MNADMKWLDNPEVFKVNQLEPHSDHCYYLDYSDMKKEKNPLLQSLNGQWEFAYSKNVMERPVDFYKETFDASGFDKIMVPGHIELAGYDKIRYINTMYPWEGKEYHRGAYSMEARKFIERAEWVEAHPGQTKADPEYIKKCQTFAKPASIVCLWAFSL